MWHESVHMWTFSRVLRAFRICKGAELRVPVEGFEALSRHKGAKHQAISSRSSHRH